MSELDPIKDAEQILKEIESETLERLNATEGAADAPQMNSAVGRLTYIDAYQQQQVALHARRKLESQLAAISSALQRVKNGTYGLCVECGTAIPPERLEFVPEAPFCVKCNARSGR
jgi:DnaK suppressor protein